MLDQNRETQVRFPDGTNQANNLLSYCFTSLQHMATTAGHSAGLRLFSILHNHGAEDQRGRWSELQ